MSQSNAATQIDKIAVLVKEKISNLDNYEDQIRSINTSLEKAQASLSGVPGVQSALDAINKNIQLNYQRGYACQNAKVAEAKMIQQIQQACAEFAQTVDRLESPTPTQNQLRLTQNMNNANTQKVQNVEVRDMPNHYQQK